MSSWPSAVGSPKWYTTNGWGKPGSPLTPGAAIALETALDAGLDGLDTVGTESELFEALPARFTRRYDDAFFERFVPVLRRVYESATADPNQLVCTCTADEIALEVLMQLAKAWAAAAVEMAAETPGAFPLASPEDEASLSDFHSLLVSRRPVPLGLGGRRHRGRCGDNGHHWHRGRLEVRALVGQTSSRPSSDRSELRTSHPYLFRGWRSVLHEGRRRGASSEACPVILALPGLGCLWVNLAEYPFAGGAWTDVATMARWKTRTSTVTFSASLRGGE